MNLPNRLPELEQQLTLDNKTVYYLQKIIKYDEGYTESFIIGVWDSQDGDIDKAAQNVIGQEKEFCECNKFIKPHTMTIRKVKATISLEEVESMSDHFCLRNKPKTLRCSNCDGNIHYGDNIVVKHYDTCDRYFCCNDCLAEFEEAEKYSLDDVDYDKLFDVSNI